MTDIQDIINLSYSEAVQKGLLPYKDTNLTSEVDDSSDEMLQVEKNFHLVFSTIVWFLDQDPFTNVAMHLDVNCRKVKQTNFTAANRKDIHSALKVDGDTFQNSPLHLLFYEKVIKSKVSSKDKAPSLPTCPEISSMSLCELRKTTKFGVEDLAYEMKLQLILRNLMLSL